MGERGSLDDKMPLSTSADKGISQLIFVCKPNFRLPPGKGTLMLPWKHPSSIPKLAKNQWPRYSASVLCSNLELPDPT